MPACDTPYFQLPNDLCEALCRANLSGREYQITLAIIRKTYGWQNPGGESEVSFTDIKKLTRLECRSYVTRVIESLEAKKVIIATHKHGKPTVYRINTNLSEWADSTSATEDTSTIEDTSSPEDTSVPDSNSTSVIEDTSTSIPDGTSSGDIHVYKEKEKKDKETVPAIAPDEPVSPCCSWGKELASTAQQSQRIMHGLHQLYVSKFNDCPVWTEKKHITAVCSLVAAGRTEQQIATAYRNALSATNEYLQGCAHDLMKFKKEFNQLLHLNENGGISNGPGKTAPPRDMSKGYVDRWGVAHRPIK
jgi:phage replication O-like protein O